MPEKQGSSWSVLRICIVIGLLSIWLLLEIRIERDDFNLFVPHTHTDKHFTDGSTLYSGFLVNTNGCRIPDLDPFDVSIRQYLYTEPEIKCEEEVGAILVESNLTYIYINESALSYYNVSAISQLMCCYTPFWRVEVEQNPKGNYPDNVDSRVRFAEECTEFDEAVEIDDEFVKVECYSSDTSIYVDYHAFTPLKKDEKNLTHKNQNEDGLSVLILGADAVSRLNLYRQMPQTLKFLKQNLSAVEMLGYNKVEDNTFPNLVPVLTGLSENELKESCWHTTSSVFDDCNYIWDNFSDLGYKTLFAEDASWMGIFNYLKRGFRKQPTDYYMRVFNKVSEDTIGFDKRMNANLCVGPRKTLNTLLSYAYKFVITMKKVLSFGFIWGASISHDYVNLPKYGDEDHKTFLESLYNQGIFNRTVFIFMSDHGMRVGGIRETYQGFLEERLPFLFIVYPDWFRFKYTTAVSNLKKNAKRLTTPFDLHEVLVDLTNLTRLEKDVVRARSEQLVKSTPLPRGISLFLPIPGTRTCSDSGIVEHWCTCHQSSSISTNNTNVRNAASYLVKHINSLLKEYTQCAKLQLNRILSAREEKSISQQNFTTSDAGIKYFSITFETVPGKALFESTVRHNVNNKSYMTVGTISRINLYGDQSLCMPQYRLRLYCYCIHN